MVNHPAQQPQPPQPPQPPLGDRHHGGQQLPNDFAHLNIDPHRNPPLFHPDRQSPPLDDPIHIAHGYQSPTVRANAPKYLGFLLTKSKSPGVDESWARVEKTKLPLAQEEFQSLLKKEKNKGLSVGKAYAHPDMKGFKRKQVDELIRDLTMKDSGYEYKLVSLRREEGRRQGGRVTLSMKIILKRQYAPDAQARLQDLEPELVDITSYGRLPESPGNRFTHQVPQPPPPPLQPFPFDHHHRGPMPPPGVPGMNNPPHQPNAGAGFQPSHPDRFADPPDQFRDPHNHHTNHAVNPSSPEPFVLEPTFDVPEQQHGSGPHPNGPDPLFDRARQPYGGQDDFEPGLFHDGPYREHTKSQEKHPSKAKPADVNPKKFGKKEKKERPASDSFDSDKSDTSGFVSDASGFSRANTNGTRDTEISDRDGRKHRNGKGRGDDWKQGHHHESRDSGHHGLHHKDSRRSSRSSRDFEIDPPRATFRTHRRRKSPLRSGNSSPSSGSRYSNDSYVVLPSSSGRERDYIYRNHSRRSSGFSQDDRPARPVHSRNVSYEEPFRGPASPLEWPSRRRISRPVVSPVDIYDERDELKESIKAELKQEQKIDELERENERLKGTPFAFSPRPHRSRRFSTDLQSDRYPYF